MIGRWVIISCYRILGLGQEQSAADLVGGLFGLVRWLERGS